MSANEPIIDLERVHQKYPHGDLTAIYTWSLQTGQPALVLVPTHKYHQGAERITPVIIPIGAAFKWSEVTADKEDAQECASFVFHALNALEINPYRPENHIRVASIIREHMPAITLMPPMPGDWNHVAADAIAIDLETGRTFEAEVSSDV